VAVSAGLARDKWLRHFLIWAVLVVLAWSGWHPKDRFTWFLEVAPVLAGLPLLLLTFRRFPLTSLAYALLALHAVILMVGGHYTYAEMPLFNGLRDALELSRNHYDRVGHVAQGFVPAIVAREILLRRSPLRPGKWLFFLVSCVCLAISACYEFVEWWVALASGDEAVAFLATQGDVWDTQWDMFLALCGALAAQLLLARWHDRQLEGILTAKDAKERKGNHG
jgi:putative membrane protein